MNKKKLLQKIINNPKNVRYEDFILIAQAFGFVHTRTDGSHNIFKNPDVGELLNLQNIKGEAKPYQIRQLLAIVERHNLKMEDK